MNELKDHASRAHALLSASSAHRWLRCPMSALAEQTEPPKDTDYTREGTLAHEVAEWVASGRSASENLPKGQDDGVTAEMLDCAREYADYLHEHTTPDTVILLEQKLDFSEWVPQGFGTADCILIDGETMTVIDYKYGTGVAVSAENNDQMRCYALGAIHDYGCLYDVTKVVMAIFQPRIGNVSEWEQTVEELTAWASDTLKPAAEKAFSGCGEYVAGSHCKFCAHAGRCRELAKACTEIVEHDGKPVEVENLAPWEMDALLRKLPMIELWIKRIQETALAKLMAGEEIPGQKLVEGRSLRKWDDAEAVQEALRAAGLGEGEYMTAPELMSPSQLEKSLGKKKAAEIVGCHVTKDPGKIGIAPAEDKRPEYKPGGEFDKLE